jgi:hypothetical protein
VLDATTEPGGHRQPPGANVDELIVELLRIRARLHRLDIATAVLLTEIETEGDGEDPLGGLVDQRVRRGASS